MNRKSARTSDVGDGAVHLACPSHASATFPYYLEVAANAAKVCLHVHHSNCK